MKIESLVRLTGGFLLNNPSVNSIENIQTDATKVKRGDFFIDIHESEDARNQAVENGAYCILGANISKITDDEIAWISVGDIAISLIKLSRFYAADKNFHFVPLSKIQYELAKCLHLSLKAGTLSREPSTALSQILKAEVGSTFFVVDSEFIEKVDPTIALAKEEVAPQQVFEKSIFYSSFIHNEKFLNDVRLNRVFIPHLCALLEYLDVQKIEYRIENFNSFEHFQAQFVDGRLHKKDFGSTGKAIIFEKDFEYFKKEIEFLESRVEGNSLLILAPKNVQEEFTCKAKKIPFEESDISILKERDFRYALVYGDIKKFEENFESDYCKQMTLF